jgi:hypothetical protein
MLCRKVLELLPRFIENDFSDEEIAEVQLHVETCERCRKEYDAMRSLVDHLDCLPTVGVPNTFKEAVMKKLAPGSDKGEDPSP